MKLIYNCLISKEVQQFYKHSSSVELSVSNKFFTCNKSLDFAQIFELLQRNHKKDLENWDYNGFVKIYETLLPIFAYTEFVASNFVANEAKVSWLGSNSQYLQLKESNETTTVEYILLATALLEHALGSIYCTVSKNRQPPNLLKDLLVTDELQSVFNNKVILFLRLLLGIPECINLRNIVWHGFPRPEDVPNYYATVLLITIHSLGCILKEKNFKIIYRQQIQNYCKYCQILKPLQSNEFLLKTVKSAVEKCNWLDIKFKAYWYQLFEHYTLAKYWQFVLLILPQIELLLRLKYASANNYEVQAKLFQYYITIDTIFDRNVPLTNHQNQLLADIKSDELESALKCIYDWFLAPNGPRLRDKVSHGEVSLKAIDCVEICDVLLIISVNLFEQQFTYESRLHTNALFSKLLNENCLLLHNFETKHLQSSQKYENKVAPKIQIFMRNKRESELMNLLLKIATQMQQIVVNYEESVVERVELKRLHKLHSKRRRTFENLLAVLPQIFEMLHALHFHMQTLFDSLQKNNEKMLTTECDFNKSIGFYKKTLQICQNLAKYSHKESNEWIKAIELCYEMQAMLKEV